jgi:hypothetical protein
MHHILYAVNEPGTALVIQTVWHFGEQPARPDYPFHFLLSRLDAMGVDAACRLVGNTTLAAMDIATGGAIAGRGLTPGPCPPDEAYSLPGVAQLDTEPRALRRGHVAGHMSSSGLAIVITSHHADGSVEIGRSLPLADLVAVGVRNAALYIGDIALRQLQTLHPSAFTPHHKLQHPPAGFDG